MSESSDLHGVLTIRLGTPVDYTALLSNYIVQNILVQFLPQMWSDSTVNTSKCFYRMHLLLQRINTAYKYYSKIYSAFFKSKCFGATRNTASIFTAKSWTCEFITAEIISATKLNADMNCQVLLQHAFIAAKN